MNRIDTFNLAEKHLTYDLEDTWTCTTPQLQRLIAEAQAAALREAAEMCDEIQSKTDKWGPMAGYCAEAIRKLERGA